MQNQDTFASSVDRLEQVARQCDVVAHLAEALAGIAKDQGQLFRSGHGEMIADIVGNRTAQQMEIIGDMLNGMDAVTGDDNWVTPIFKEAQRCWPQAKPCAWCGEKPVPQPEPVSPGTAPNTESSPNTAAVVPGDAGRG